MQLPWSAHQAIIKRRWTAVAPRLCPISWCTSRSRRLAFNQWFISRPNWKYRGRPSWLPAADGPPAAAKAAHLSPEVSFHSLSRDRRSINANLLLINQTRSTVGIFQQAEGGDGELRYWKGSNNRSVYFHYIILIQYMFSNCNWIELNCVGKQATESKPNPGRNIYECWSRRGQSLWRYSPSPSCRSSSPYCSHWPVSFSASYFLKVPLISIGLFNYNCSSV